MKRKVVLIVILFLALFLRVYKLGSYPVGFLWDEAAIGYNAYSIIKTGSDEHGKFLPIVFKSFGDYKPGFYIYLTIPSVLIFGLNEFAVRFPSALFGCLTVLIFYLLAGESLKKRLSRIDADFFSLVGSALLAVNPWHIMFSRGGWEVNVMVFELLLGLYLIIKFLNDKKSYLLIFSAISFLLSLLTYQSAKFLMPVLVFGIAYFFRRKFLGIEKRKLYLVSTGLILGFLAFNLYTIMGGRSGRIKVMSLFSYPRSPEETEIYKSQEQKSVNYSIFHNSPFFFLRAFAERYFNYFSGKFLFVTGDWSNERNGVAYQGVLYYVDILFLIIGLYLLFSRERDALGNFMLFWLVTAPLPAALTRDSVSSVRSLTMVVPLIYIITIGISGMFRWIGRFSPRIKFTFYILPFAFYIFFFFRFVDLYFVHDKVVSSESRLLGYKEMFLYIEPLIAKKNKAIITSFYGQPYIFYLFYTKYDPKTFQEKIRFIDNPYGDVGRVDRLDNIEFRKIYFPDDQSNKNSLFVGNEFDLALSDITGRKNNIVFDKEIKFLDNKTAFRIVETK